MSIHALNAPPPGVDRQHVLVVWAVKASDDAAQDQREMELAQAVVDTVGDLPIPEGVHQRLFHVIRATHGAAKVAQAIDVLLRIAHPGLVESAEAPPAETWGHVRRFAYAVIVVPLASSAALWVEAVTGDSELADGLAEGLSGALHLARPVEPEGSAWEIVPWTAPQQT